MPTSPDEGDGRPRDAWFYHLERGAPDEALPELLEKTLARGWRALVRTIDADRLARIDDTLWTWRPDSFLPHATSEDANAPRQPILLTTGEDNLNAAQVLFILDAAPARVGGYERCVVLFDGTDPQALARARALWSLYRAAGAPMAYWKQEGRGWARQA